MKKYIAKLFTIITVSLFSTGVFGHPLGGEKRNVGMIMPGRTITYSFILNANEQTRIAVDGDGFATYDGNSDIDCYVFDENGNIVAFDTSPLNRCRINVLPSWKGPFIILLINHGSKSSNFEINVW